MLKRVRQEGALKRLEAQLQSGIKPVKGSLTQTIVLTDTDKKRIQKEIQVLKQKLK